MFAVILMGFFGLGALAFVGVVVVGVVKRLRGRESGDWQDDTAAGDPPKVRPGPGWGNGGSWN
jgi:hypothetical protein